MPEHSIESELGERLDIETPKQAPSEGDSCTEFLRSIKKTGESSTPPSSSPTSHSVRLYFPDRKGYPRTVDLTPRYLEQTGKFRENADQEVFLLAKGGDATALAELIYRAVSRKEAFVVARTHSLSTKDPDFEPASIITLCLCKVLGPDNSRFQKRIESASHFFGDFHEALKNRIRDGYRKWGVRPIVLTDSQMGADGNELSSSMENLPNERALYASEEQKNDPRPLVLRAAIKRCLNAKESEHLLLFAQGVSLQERMELLGFSSPNATYLNLMRARDKVKAYIKKHPELFDI